MHSCMNPRFAAVLFAAACAMPAAGMACSLVPLDSLLLKKMMAREIAFRLAINVDQVALDDITTPQLHRPLEMGANCSGLAVLHHSAGFRVALVRQQRGFVTMAKPHTATGAGARARERYATGFYRRWPGAGVRPNFWRAFKPKLPPEPDYSGYQRWPQYPTERGFAAAVPPAGVPLRWPQYPQDVGSVTVPTHWSTLSVLPAEAQQGFCRYEGMAVVLGNDAASPVEVNFRQQCD